MFNVRIVDDNKTVLFECEMSAVPRVGDRIYIPKVEEAGAGEDHLEVTEVRWSARPTGKNEDGTPTGEFPWCNVEAKRL